MNLEGVRNRDWYAPLGADGYATTFDLTDPDIAYIQSQQGNLQRVNLHNHELINIRPLPAPGEPPERWNWDAPVIASPHAEGRIYYASQRVWRSDDRGNSWTAVSGDLTRNDNRYELPMAGRVRSVDALYGNTAMSWYSTIPTISESPVAEGVLYAGTDDGLIQATEDGGANWRQASPPPGLPERAFMNDIKASQHDAATVFVAADNHKGRATFGPTSSPAPTTAAPGNPSRATCPTASSSGRSSRTTSIPICSSPAPRTASTSPRTAAPTGSCWARARPRSRSVIWRSSAATTIWWEQPSAAASTSWTTTHRWREMADGALAAGAALFARSGRLVVRPQRPAAGPRKTHPRLDRLHRAQPRFRRHLHLLAGGPAGNAA